MIYAALLLIIAILLFGSSAIFGAFTAVLGFLVAVAALGFAAMNSAPIIEAMGLNAQDAPALIVMTICVILLLGRLAVFIFGRDR